MKYLQTGDRSEYITAAGPGVLKVKPWTGRLCNADIDVVHFSVAVLVRSSSVMGFMKELCSEKEHTFREGFSKDGRQIVYKHKQINILSSNV